MRNFNKNLIQWHLKHKRLLPWKDKIDVYQVWLSEIMLQQTRVEQGLPYYLKFIEKYPTVNDFANAPIDDILKLWEGLGYYSRARNMHATALNIRDNYNGKFPDTFEGLKKLKGIGDYTAAAIASFAYGLPYAVVDGNVYRVLARYLGQDIPIDTPQGKKYFQQKAQELLNEKEPGAHNQAMMDFGSLVCTPKNPKCEACPFASECVAFSHNWVEKLPKKEKKLPKKERFLHYFVFSDGKNIVLNRRGGNDIWKLLYDFPQCQPQPQPQPPHPPKGGFLSASDVSSIVDIKKLPEPLVFKQTLTHQKITAFFYEINHLRIKQPELYITVSIGDLNKYAFPKIIANYLTNRLLLLP
jgi:A/G-specific adenine glycosylase